MSFGLYPSWQHRILLIMSVESWGFVSHPGCSMGMHSPSGLHWQIEHKRFQWKAWQHRDCSFMQANFFPVGAFGCVAIKPNFSVVSWSLGDTYMIAGHISSVFFGEGIILLGWALLAGSPVYSYLTSRMD